MVQQQQREQHEQQREVQRRQQAEQREQEAQQVEQVEQVEQRRHRALAGHYWPTVALVLLALCPDLVINSAFTLVRPSIAASLKSNEATLALATTFGNAGWAFGAVLAADLSQRFRQDILLLLYEAAFILGSILAAAAPTAGLVVAGHIIEGTATGMLLVVALPPLITGFPVERIGITAAFVDIGLFGAVTAGPLVGGWVAQTGTWRWFFAAAALLGALGLVMGLLAMPRRPAFNPGLKRDDIALVLAAAGAGLTFYGVGELTGRTWTAPIVWLPTALGLTALVILIALEYRKREALMPVKPISTTFPVMGIASAVISGAMYTGMLSLAFLILKQGWGQGPLMTGLLTWPDLVLALLASVLFGLLFNTRYFLILPLAGMLCLIAAAWLYTTLGARPDLPRLLGIAALLGLGAGLTVSPGLFMAALSVSAQLVGRAFALVELLRLAGAFAFVPVFMHFALVNGTHPAQLALGIHRVAWIIVILTAVSIAGITLVFIIGGAHLHPPELGAYVERGETALNSPPVLGTGERD